MNRIRKRRVEIDSLSQAQLAREMDVGRQTLNAIERGQRPPPLEVVHCIADALECDLDEVFHYESEFPAKDDDDGRFSIKVWLNYDRNGGSPPTSAASLPERSAVVTRHAEPAMARDFAQFGEFTLSDGDNHHAKIRTASDIAGHR